MLVVIYADREKWKYIVRKDKKHSMVQQIDRSSIDEPKPPPQLNWAPRIVHIRATVKELEEPLIRFAMLRSDPLADFRKCRETNDQQTEEADDQLVAVEAAWNASFAGLRDDQLFFVYAWSAIPGAPPRVTEVAGLSFYIATPGPLLKRWLTTQPVRRKGELVVWCESIDMHEGAQDGQEGEEAQAMEVVLGEENMIRLVPEPAGEDAMGVVA